MSTVKAPVRVERFHELEFAPRFEYGEMAEVSGICGVDDGTELGTGWGRLHELQARDCIWLPKGTELIYEAKSALIHFAIHPANWSTKA